MRRLRLIAFLMMSLLAVAGCASRQSVPECPPPPAPPAWTMQEAPDLLTPLNGIIGVSESESEPSPSN